MKKTMRKTMENSQNVIKFPINHSSSNSLPQKGWSYLLADSLAFNKEVDFGIRIQKPNIEKMPKWIEKIITSGQCNSIYVENLKLQESDKIYIDGLCRKHNVSLFSLSVIQETQMKVIQGPW